MKGPPAGDGPGRALREASIGHHGRPGSGRPGWQEGEEGQEGQIEPGERCWERKVRRPGSSAPPGLLRPTTTLGRRTSSLLLPPGVPPFENPFPFIGLSLGRPPPNDHHREAAQLMGVLCTTPVATGAVLGCSSVALFLRRHKGGRAPLFPPGGDCAPSPGGSGRCVRGPCGSWRAASPAGSPHAGPSGSRLPSLPTGGLRRAVRTGAPAGRHVAHSARERNPRTRVALRNRFRSKDPNDTNPGAAPLRGGRHLVKIEQPPDHPASPRGDRGARLLLLHPAPAAKGPSGAAGRRAPTSRWGTRCRPSAASSAPSSRSTATATRS